MQGRWGEVFRPQCESEDIFFGCSAVEAKYFMRGTKDIYIYIGNESTNQGLRLNSSKVSKENTFCKLFSAPKERFMTALNRGSAPCNKNYIDTNNVYDKLFINELDTLNAIIGGEFNFTGYNECTGDPIEVTEGKFRLHYTY